MPMVAVTTAPAGECACVPSFVLSAVDFKMPEIDGERLYVMYAVVNFLCAKLGTFYRYRVMPAIVIGTTAPLHTAGNRLAR
jgi:hypothetical protein